MHHESPAGQVADDAAVSGLLAEFAVSLDRQRGLVEVVTRRRWLMRGLVPQEHLQVFDVGARSARAYGWISP